MKAILKIVVGIIIMIEASHMRAPSTMLFEMFAGAVVMAFGLYQFKEGK
jgi:hypothetical protein